MRRLAFLTFAAASFVGCELIVSTTGFDLPVETSDDASVDAPADHADADVIVPACACPDDAAARHCASSAARFAAEAGCGIDALDAGDRALLACSAGAWSVATDCNSGCGVNDMGKDQCECPCYAGPGDYCGFGALDAGARLDCFVSGATMHAEDLFTCAGNKDGGVWSFKISCPSGCMYNPGGSDTCK